MSVLQNKIDFVVLVKVTNANPNGDPLNGNRPRTTYTGKGEISDVCIEKDQEPVAGHEGENFRTVGRAQRRRLCFPERAGIGSPVFLQDQRRVRCPGMRDMVRCEDIRAGVCI